MAIEVAKVELKTVQDASGLEACLAEGQFTADEVIAVIGKTEGNGGVNDFTRILADQAFRRVLARLASGARSRSPAFRWCGRAAATASSRRMRRCSRERQDRSGVAVAPGDRHRDERRAPARGHRPARDGREGRRRRQGRDARRRHRRSEGRALRADQDAAADHRSVRDAESRGQHVACEVHDSMGVSNGTTALGIAVALGEISMPRPGRSARTSTSTPRSRRARLAWS